MNLKPGGKESGNGGKGSRHAAADNKRQHNTDTERNGSKVKNMAKKSACIDALVHDHRCKYHACANHTADREVGTSEQDQAADPQRQEHTRRGCLENIQDIVHCQQRHTLDNRAENTQNDEDNENYDVQTVSQQKLLDIESIAVGFPLLFPLFGKGETAETELIKKMVTMGKGGMLAVLNRLEGGAVFESGVKQAVFIDVFLVLDLIRILQFAKFILMLPFQFRKLCIIACIFRCRLRCAGSDNLIVVFLVIVGIQIRCSIIDQSLDLASVGSFNRFGFRERCPILREYRCFLLPRKVGVFLYDRHVIGQRDYPVCAIRTQGIYLLLYGSDIFVDRCQQKFLLLRCQDDPVLFIHVFSSASVHRYFALSLRSSSWLVSFVLTTPARRLFDMTPIRLVIPSISGISEDTTMMVLPSLAMLMMSS